MSDGVDAAILAAATDQWQSGDQLHAAIDCWAPKTIRQRALALGRAGALDVAVVENKFGHPVRLYRVAPAHTASLVPHPEGQDGDKDYADGQRPHHQQAEIVRR